MIRLLTVSAKLQHHTTSIIQKNMLMFDNYVTTIPMLVDVLFHFFAVPALRG